MAGSRSRTGPKLRLGDGVLQQVQWPPPHHHVPQAAHEACAICLRQGLAHRQFLQASCRTQERPPDGDSVMGRPGHWRAQ